MVVVGDGDVSGWKKVVLYASLVGMLPLGDQTTVEERPDQERLTGGALFVWKCIPDQAIGEAVT